MKNNFLEQTIVKHLAGSQAYTSTPESDTDYRGIFLANKEYILTPFLMLRKFQILLKKILNFMKSIST
ncbi:UNVERIFIED_ORG: hypothetical protein [Escherichia phage CMSTMSU]